MTLTGWRDVGQRGGCGLAGVAVAGVADSVLSRHRKTLRTLSGDWEAPPVKTALPFTSVRFLPQTADVFYCTLTATGRDAIPLHTTRTSLRPVWMFLGTSKLVEAGVVYAIPIVLWSCVRA